MASVMVTGSGGGEGDISGGISDGGCSVVMVSMIVSMMTGSGCDGINDGCINDGGSISDDGSSGGDSDWQW